MSESRLKLLSLCHDIAGKPYVWGAKGPDTFDCSGVVTWLLHEVGGPDWRALHNAQRLWNELEPTDRPAPGDLAFYGHGKNLISHVMVCFDGGPNGRVFGACGGNQYTTSAELAAKIGARVRFRNTKDYRPDFKGFRKLPL